MQYEEFIGAVADRAGLSRDEAIAVTRATIETLAERLTGGEAHDLASQLPGEMQPWMEGVNPPGTAPGFDCAEFKRRVAQRAGLPEPAVDAGIRAVFATLREAVTPGEFDDVLAQLPTEYRELMHSPA